MSSNLPNIYSPSDEKPAYGSKGTFNATQSQLTRNRTVKEDTVYSILSRLGVRYQAQQVVDCPGEFDGNGRPISYLVDARIIDGRYGWGILNVNGAIHNCGKHPKRDAIRDERLAATGHWVEDIQNPDVCEASVRAILVKHFRGVDDYGGSLSA